MTVYVWRNSTNRPRLQHRLNPASYSRSVSYCGTVVDTAEYHAQGRYALTTYEYAALPMCKRCERRRDA